MFLSPSAHGNVFPYWVERAHKLLKKGPTDLAGPETLAIAHAPRAPTSL